MDLIEILVIVRDTLYSVELLFALLYSCLILFVRNLHTQNNIFILNILINMMTGLIYFMIYFYAVAYDMSYSLCILFQFAFNIASVQVPFAFVAFTIHRFCAIVYHSKGFFKSKKWVAMCISIQWITQFVISLAFVFKVPDSCTGNTFWMGIYTVVTSIVLPFILNFGFNMGIFIYARKSSRRVQIQITSSEGISGQNQQQQPRISRRDISLLRQMIFTFTMFIVGWTPAFVVNTITATSYVDDITMMITIYLSAICPMFLMINLFIFNYDVREYLSNRIRRCCHCVRN